MKAKTATEVAEDLRCSVRKVTDTATKFNIGANLKGRAGFRFTESDVLALWEAMRPKTETTRRRHRRAS